MQCNAKRQTIGVRPLLPSVSKNLMAVSICSLSTDGRPCIRRRLARSPVDPGDMAAEPRDLHSVASRWYSRLGEIHRPPPVLEAHRPAHCPFANEASSLRPQGSRRRAGSRYGLFDLSDIPDCPTCGEDVHLQYGKEEFPGRLVGRCGVHLAEHVYSFDRHTKVGKLLR